MASRAHHGGVPEEQLIIHSGLTGYAVDEHMVPCGVEGTVQAPETGCVSAERAPPGEV